MIIWALLALAQSTELAFPCPSGIGNPVSMDDGNVTMPKLIRSVKPAITVQARKAGIPPSVLILSIVVPVEGPPCSIRVVSPIGLGLDQAAIAAVRQWEFKPAIRDSKPVASTWQVEVRFFIEGHWVDTDEENRTRFNIALNEMAQGNARAELAAVKKIEKLSDKKYAPAEAYFGFLLYSGEFVVQDYPRAVELISRANKKSVPYGIFAMAVLLAEGKALPANPDEALRLMREASVAGVPAAQMWLAKYALRRGDQEMAKRYFRLCAATAEVCKQDLANLK